MKPEKKKHLAEAKVRYCFTKKCEISLLLGFWNNKYNFINNFTVRFMYEYDMTTS